MEDMDIPYWRRYDWDGDGDVDDDDARVFLSRHLLIRLTDTNKNPIPGAKCRIAGDSTKIYECDNKGIVPIPVPDGNPTSIDLEWELSDAEKTDPSNRFYWQNTFQLSIKNLNDEDASLRLTHLGFEGDTLADQKNAYKVYFNRTTDDIIKELALWHDGGDKPGTKSGATVASGAAVAATSDSSNTSESNPENSLELSICLCDHDLVPHAEKKYTVHIDENEIVSDTTDKNGYARFSVPSATAQFEIRLWLWPGAPEYIPWDISLV